MSMPSARQVRKPPYDLDITFRVNDETIVKIAKHLDRHMGWSGYPASPASRDIVQYILGLVEAKQAGEARHG